MRTHRDLYWALAAGLAVWAVVYGMRLNPVTNVERLRADAQARVAVDTQRSGAALYASACAGCHQGQGEGRFPVFPPLASSHWVTGDSDRLVALTLHGLSGPIDVNAQHYTGLMPGFAHLSDRELAQVLTHVRTSWGNRAAPITETQVAAMRAATSRRQTPWLAEELQGAVAEDAP